MDDLGFIVDKVVTTATQAYANDSKIKRDIDRSYALWVAANAQMPNSVGDCEYFRRFVRILNPRYCPLGRTATTDAVAELGLRIKSKIREILAAVQRIAVVLDFWSAADGTPFLGIVHSYFNGYIRCVSVRKKNHLCGTRYHFRVDTAV